MTKDEALKLALEALEANHFLIHGSETKGGLAFCMDGYYSGCFDIDSNDKQTNEAITAIKEALAQPEQDGKCKYCTDGCPACDARKLPEQEPVGWAEHGVINWLADKQFNHTSFLYDTPAQSTWVGLTNQERSECWETIPELAMKKVEAKLKEKNT